MDEEIERLVVAVRADTAGFARDVAAMRAELDGPFAQGAERAGRTLDTVLVRAARTGRLGLEELARATLALLAEIAASADRAGLAAILGGLATGGGWRGPAALFAGAGGAPGRAAGGPVAPGRAYLVGERGPELFAPAQAGSILPNPAAGPGGGRDVRVAITIMAPGGAEPAQALRRSGRQIARAVRRALER
jgi:phage-related minor tail protein